MYKITKSIWKWRENVKIYLEKTGFVYSDLECWEHVPLKLRANDVFVIQHVSESLGQNKEQQLQSESRSSRPTALASSPLTRRPGQPTRGSEKGAVKWCGGVVWRLVCRSGVQEWCGGVVWKSGAVKWCGGVEGSSGVEEWPN